MFQKCKRLAAELRESISRPRLLHWRAAGLGGIAGGGDAGWAEGDHVGDDGFDLGGGEVFSVGGHVAAALDDLARWSLVRRASTSARSGPRWPPMPSIAWQFRHCMNWTTIEPWSSSGERPARNSFGVGFARNAFMSGDQGDVMPR